MKLEIGDQSGKLVPAKVQFIPIGGTPPLNLGPDIRARGCGNQYFSTAGIYTQQLPPGAYLLRITRGPEHDLAEREVQLQPGQVKSLSVVLSRSVDTTGWISSDFHSHTTESGDSQTGIPDRLINMAAEQIEFAPSTEHNRISDWRPQLLSLGLQPFLKTVPGLELTRSEETHLNAFPLESTPYLQDGGAPPWPPPGPSDPRITALTLRAMAGGRQERWVQLNHPSIGHLFNDRDRDHSPDGGYTPGFELLVDGTEASGAEILNLSPSYEPRPGIQAENRTFGWLRQLNQGRRLWNIAASDEHRVCGGICGLWRTYVQSSQDDPAAIDVDQIIASSKAGRMMMTNGPFLGASMHPMAYHNPIFVDLPGDGFQANGDTLGHPLLVSPNFPERNP